MASSSDELWSELVPKFAKVPLLAYRNRHRINRWWKQGLVKVGLGKTNIVIVGRSAVGKSVLMERLNGRPGDINWTAPNLSRVVESTVLSVEEAPLITRAVPGQVSRERDVGIHEALSHHDSLEGVIYVVDWGYTIVRDEAVRDDLINRRNVRTLKQIREFNLADEVRDFADLTQRIRESISRSKTPKWLLIVVNKADLFMSKVNAAQKYYHPELQSEFTIPLHRLIEQVGKDNLACEAIPVSVWHEDFEWNSQLVRSHLDEADARALFKNMFLKISALSAQVKR